MKSPCIKVCKLTSDTKICIGCFRTLTEIQNWAKMTDKERDAIMERKPKELLQDILTWYYDDFGKNKLKDIINNIETYLENEKATQK